MHFDFNQILPNLPASYIFPPLQVLEPLTSTLLAFLQFPEDRMVLCVCTQTWDLSKKFHDRIFGTKILHAKTSYFVTIFTKKKNSANALILAMLEAFLLEFNWVCKILTLSVQYHAWYV